MLPGIYLQGEDLCVDAQQAEKAIKAVLIARGAAFPPIHDLGGLLTILGQNDEAIPPAVADAARLTRFRSPRGIRASPSRSRQRSTTGPWRSPRRSSRGRTCASERGHRGQGKVLGQVEVRWFAR